jgi:hypothetical protein
VIKHLWWLRTWQARAKEDKEETASTEKDKADETATTKKEECKVFTH